MTARVPAHELRLSLHTVQLDKLVTKFMGETSAKLRKIFDLIRDEVGVYLFDEFDAIGGERSFDTDVGEMRRVLNAFLQFIEQDASDSLIIGATNNPRLLDRALFRRFDDVLYYHLPPEGDRRRLTTNVLGSFMDEKFPWPEKKVTAYANEVNSRNGKPRNAPLVESISDVKVAVLESFWQDEKKLLPSDAPDWVEVWLSSEDLAVIEKFEALCHAAQMSWERGGFHFQSARCV